MNLGGNLLNFMVAIAVGVFFTPYLIHHLGVAGYGLVPLATSFMSYLGLLTTAINAPLGRYMTMALTKKEILVANRFFNTAFWATSGLLAITFVPLLLICWKGLGWLKIPLGMESQFSILATCTLLVFYLHN